MVITHSQKVNAIAKKAKADADRAPFISQMTSEGERNSRFRIKA